MVWNTGNMVPGMPEEHGPNPKDCDIDCSQPRDRDPQGCVVNFQEGQKDHNQVQRTQ